MQIRRQVATAQTAQRMLTPQDSKEQLLLLATERIEGATFSPRKGGAAANAIQHVLTDVRIGDHGQAVDITACGLVGHVRLAVQEGDAFEEREPAQNSLTLAAAPATHPKGGRVIDDDLDAQHLGALVVQLDPVALVAVLDAKTRGVLVPGLSGIASASGSPPRTDPAGRDNVIVLA
jgi:hypothetical protein